MATTFPDRWGVPVQAAREKAVALLDEAVEQLAANGYLPAATDRGAAERTASTPGGRG